MFGEYIAKGLVASLVVRGILADVEFERFIADKAGAGVDLSQLAIWKSLNRLKIELFVGKNMFL